MKRSAANHGYSENTRSVLLLVTVVVPIDVYQCSKQFLLTSKLKIVVEAVLELKAAKSVNVSGVCKISSSLVAAADKRFLGDSDLGDFNVFVHSSSAVITSSVEHYELICVCVYMDFYVYKKNSINGYCRLQLVAVVVYCTPSVLQCHLSERYLLKNAITAVDKNLFGEQ
uniref:Uncharacterized protein n=1 Tax=Glossina palpalis gambiensis TaxID=67801 RepID=A0A1B0B4Q5_9MUSC